MSNYLAIAAVTAALHDILQNAALTVSGTDVTLKRPERVSTDGQDKAAINMYLYQTSPNPSWSNVDLPTRNGNGGLVRRPQIALNLDYLISFYGSELVMEPQRLLGSALAALNAHPVLEMDTIKSAIDSRDYLSQSTIFDQTELVKFGQINLSLEELSKLWSIFFQVPYTLSVVFRASPVFVEAQLDTLTVKLVAEKGVHIGPVPGNHEPLVTLGEQLKGNTSPSSEVP
jgi:Pvc16 N-terminal domain